MEDNQEQTIENDINLEQNQSSESEDNTTDTAFDDQLAALSSELASEKDKFLRLFAEFENYKKRTSKERIELFKTANQEVMQALLPVLDDFDRAMTELLKQEDNSLLQGIKLIHDKFTNTMKNKGLELLEVKVGDPFNADFAEAITQIPAPTEDMKGRIIDIVEKGYKLGDKIIRFPKVVTGM